MIAEDVLIRKINNLPPRQVAEVSDFVDSLLATDQNGSNESAPDMIERKIQAIREWALSHAGNKAVLLNDSREFIYED